MAKQEYIYALTNYQEGLSKAIQKSDKIVFLLNLAIVSFNLNLKK